MDLIQNGQKISLNIIKQDTVVEIIGIINEVFDDRLVVELPPYFMRYIEFLDVGCVLMAKIFSKIGTIDFKSIVISSPLEDEHFEIEFDVNALKYTPSSELPVIDSIENLKIIKDDGEINTKTYEISTEYIKFYCDTELGINEAFNCELILPKEYGTLCFKINITEHDIVYDNEYKASYYNMSEQDREALLYYMYVYENKKFGKERDSQEADNQVEQE